MRALEARIAFDAAAIDTVDQAVTTDAISAETSADSSFFEFAAHLASASEPSGAAQAEIAFIDQTVPDVAELLKGFSSAVEVVLLDRSRDGVAQIAEVLATRSDVRAIHIIAHGSDAALELGTAHLTANAMESAYQTEMRLIRDALSDDADILIYGCNFGSGEAGAHAVDVLASLTGADVAASDDATGDAALGGDWDLEVTRGGIEARVAVSFAVQQTWHHTLLTAAADGTETLVNTTTSGTQTSDYASGRQIASDSSGNYVVVWEDSSSGSSEVYARLYYSDGSVKSSAFRVNTTTSSTQDSPSVAMDANGNFVVAWKSNGNGGDTSGYGIFAQRYNSSGVAQGSEFQVNTYTTFDQDEPAIAMSTTGFVVTWTSYGNDGSLNGVYGQRYDASGNAQGANFLINQTTTNDQEGSSVAMTSTGAFVVTWQSADSSNWGIYGRMYNASGAALTSEFLVNTYTSGDQRYSSVALDQSGNFLVTWSSYGEDTSGWGVYGQRYNASGVTQGSEFLVSSTISSDQHHSNAAFNSTGAFVVTWGSYSQDGHGWGQYGRLFTSSGVRDGDEFRINSTTSGEQTYSDVTWVGSQIVASWGGNGAADSAGVYTQRFTTAQTLVPANISGSETLVNTTTSGTQQLSWQGGKQIAADSSGNYIVVWDDGAEVYGRLYYADGTARSSAFRVNTTTTGTQINSAVSMDASGNFVVVWEGNPGTGTDSSGYGIYAQRYNAAGVAQGSEFVVNTTTNSDETQAAVAMNASGFVVSWTGYYGQDGSGNGIYAQRYDASGTAIGSEFRVNTTTNDTQYESQVAMNATGDFVISWSSVWQPSDGSGIGIYAQRYNAAGVAQGSEFLVNTTTNNDQRYSDIAIDSLGNFVVTWSSYAQDGDNWGIYAQRFNASGVKQGAEFRVNDQQYHEQRYSSVAMSTSGDFIISYQSYSQDGSVWGVFAKTYNASGYTSGNEFRVPTTTSSDQQYSSVAWGGTKFVVAWSGNGVGDTSGVFTQRYETANQAPSDNIVSSTPSGGLSINTSGNDTYLLADNGSAILGGRTQLTLEAQFSMSSSATSENPLFSYAVDGTADNEVYLRISPSGRLTLAINAVTQTTTNSYAQLLDGTKHTVSVSWNSTGGAVVFYVDGTQVESFTGLKSGYTIASGGTLVIGQDQDIENGNFNSTQVFSGTFYDARIFDTVRTSGQVSANYSGDVAWNTSNLVANWQFNALSTGGVTTDTVSGNNLTISHTSGTGFTSNTPSLTLTAPENSTAGTIIGTITATDLESTAKIQALLRADSNLYYSAETNKFYRYVTTSQTWTTAEAYARSASIDGTGLLNGVTGQLVTIGSAAEQEFVAAIAAAKGTYIWLGASDQASEGVWRWYSNGSVGTQFWSGASGGAIVNGQYENWKSGEPNDFFGTEEYAEMYTDGTWNDSTSSASNRYVVEFDANAVLSVTNALTYSITSQTVAGAFTINSSTGTITVADASKIDYETNPTHSVTVRVTDAGGLTYDKTFTISLTNVYEAPTITSNGAGASAAISQGENQTAVTTVTTLLDASKTTATYSIIGGADSANFTINSSTGALSFVTAPNYESPSDAGANNVYDVTVQVSDGTSTDTQAIAVTVTNVNEAPILSVNGTNLLTNGSFDSPTVTNINANNFQGTSWTGWTANQSINVIRVNGTSYTPGPDNADSGTQYVDLFGNGYIQQSFTLATTATISFGASFSNRDLTGGSFAYAAPASKVEILNGLGTVVASGSLVNLTSSVSGEIWIQSVGTATLAAGNYTYRVTMDDCAHVDTSYVNLVDNTASYTENASPVAIVNANAAIIDVDNSNLTSATVTLTNQQTGDRLFVNGSSAASGTLSSGITWTRTDSLVTFSGTYTKAQYVTALQSVQFENTTEDPNTSPRTITTVVSDGTNASNTVATTVSVIAANDAPTVTSGSTASVAENATSVMTVTGADVDGGTTLTYSISGGADSSLFTINSSTGALSFVTAPNYESPTDTGTNNVYDVIVEVSDGALTATKAIAVTVTNVNEAPSVTSSGTANVAENSTSVMTVTGADVDAGATLTYSISGGFDASLFTINSSTGALSFLAAPNYESPADTGSNNVYDVTVQVSDGTLAATQAIAVTVTNVNEAPVINLPGPRTTTEDTYKSFASSIGNAITISDVDSGSNEVELTITAVNGTASLNSTAGLTFSVGDGSAATTMTFRGTVAAINTALDWIRYTPTSNFHGTGGLDFSLNDLGNSGSGGPITVTANQVVTVTAVNDSPVGLPVITGTAAEDQTLTADVSAISDVDGLGTISYQWLRNGASIAGATSSTYQLGDADVGGAISVRVTYIDGDGTTETLTSTGTAAVTNVNDIPSGLPSISGTATEAQTLTAGTGSISDADGLGSFSYQWNRDGVAISGATASTYTLTNADVGGAISVTVSYTDGHGTSEALTSAPTSAVANINDAPTGAPVITGTEAQNATLTADTSGIADGDGLGAFAYQWKRDGAAISGATSSTYALIEADVGAAITVTVSYSDGHGANESVTSSPTGLIANVNDAPTGLPAITGTATEDQTLTAATGAIGDIDGLGAFSYQWKRDGVSISGATASSYTLGDADVGKAITVMVSYTDAHGTAETLTSLATASVVNINDAPIGLPVVTGAATEGQTLTANTSGLSDADGLGALSYQWLRDGVDIAGATGSSYALIEADVGAAMSVRVTYTDARGTSETVTSAQTAAVQNVNSAPSGLPVITGTATEDQILSVDTTALSDTDGLGSFAYEWLRDGVVVSGATGATYTLGDADVGKAMSVTVTYVDGHGTVEAVTSAATSAIDNVNDPLQGVPAISGVATENQVLSVDMSSVTDADGLGVYSYQWLRDGVAISGATSASYTLVDADVTYKISVAVSYTDDHGTLETVASPETPAVANVNDGTLGQPAITGTPTENQVLTADTSALADEDGLGTVSYQWKRNGVAVSGATNSTYALGNADVGFAMTVTVSYTDGFGTHETVTSLPTVAVANVNDAPAGTLSITGTAAENQTLTADTSSITDADGLDTLSFQWYRNGAAIGGANAASYVPVDADVGTALTVSVSYIDQHGTAESLTSGATTLISNVNDAPTGAPVVTGTATENQTLGVNTGAIADEDGLGAFSYQWLRNGVAVSGATGSTYLLTDSDVGAAISIAVSYTDGFGTTETLVSGATSAVLNVNNAPTGAALISGTAVENETLMADTSGIADEDGLGAFSYQWTRDGVAIAGAISATYTLTNSDVDGAIRVVVGYTDGHGTAESLTSAPTSPIANVNDAPTGLPVISGAAIEGATLTVDTLGIADLDVLGVFSYQWHRDGVAVSGATSPTYTLTDADVGAAITISVSWLDLHGTSELLTSLATSAVQNVNDAPVGGISLSGGTNEGQTLTAVTAALSDGDGLGSFSYEWRRNSVAISGANGATYTSTNADVGMQISVAVTYTDGHGTTETVASAASATIQNINDAPVGVPAIIGTPIENETLSVNAVGLSDGDGMGPLSYQWLRDGVAVAGETGLSYVLTDADVGRAISVEVGYTDLHGTAETLISASTAAVANINDAPAGVPTITGAAIENGTLTVDGAGLSDDDGLGAISYQWTRNGAAISGATGATYTLTNADVGAAITASASFTDGFGTVETVSSLATAAVQNVNDAPTGIVSISGAAVEDGTLAADVSTIADADGLGTLVYEWQRDGVAISGATTATYTLGDADVGRAMALKVSYVDLHGSAEELTSLATAAVANINDVPTGAAVISGAAVEGSTLTADVSTLDDADGLGTLAYQWLRDGGDIAGATLETYTLISDDIGAAISVRVGFTDAEGSLEQVLSAATSQVTPLPRLVTQPAETSFGDVDTPGDTQENDEAGSPMSVPVPQSAAGHETTTAMPTKTEVQGNDTPPSIQQTASDVPVALAQLHQSDVEESSDAFAFNLPGLVSLSSLENNALGDANGKATTSDQANYDLALLHTAKKEETPGDEEGRAAAEAEHITRISVGVGSSVVALAAAWTLRAAATAGSMFASIPLWRGLDVLPLALRRRILEADGTLSEAEKIFEKKI